ncbi:hypothetical protein SADUNF_Sadunf11G0109800 [Salix dunnii]|uniref:Uncharacterized protein n=1 Tax=Salix dunnii TaxID=1413687 RepID=A0A835JNN5_9ROSI|nr:hypothetical protein SADUNF_Sadunf11G0109800 [Salix dunnii]
MKTPVVLLGIECVLANDNTLAFLFSVAEQKRSLRSTHYQERIILPLLCVTASLGCGTGGNSSPYFSYISLRILVSSAEYVPDVQCSTESTQTKVPHLNHSTAIFTNSWQNFLIAAMVDIILQFKQISCSLILEDAEIFLKEL